MHKSLTRRLLALLNLEKDIGVKKKVATAGSKGKSVSGSLNKDPNAWSREKQLNSELAVNSSLPSSEKIGRTLSKNRKSKGKVTRYHLKSTQRQSKNMGRI